jgi:prepilin peptidase CpaA
MILPTTFQLTLLLLAALLVYAAARDLDEYKIPNRISLAVTGLYPSFAIAAGVSPTQVLVSGGLALAVLIVGVILYMRGTMGGGDAKLAAATMLWAGPDFGIWFLIITGLAGGAMAIAIISPYRGMLAHACDRLGRTGNRNPFLKTVLPYGVAICVGGLFVVALRLGFVSVT